MKNDKLSKIFNLDDEDGNNEVEESSNLPVESSSNSLEVIDDFTDFQDLKRIRDNLENYTRIGETALQELLDVAVQSQSPRAYEVLGQLIRSLTDVNREVSEQINQNISRKTTKVQENNITNNNLYISTSELLDQLTKRKDD